VVVWIYSNISSEEGWVVDLNNIRPRRKLNHRSKKLLSNWKMCIMVRAINSVSLGKGIVKNVMVKEVRI